MKSPNKKLTISEDFATDTQGLPNLANKERIKSLGTHLTKKYNVDPEASAASHYKQLIDKIRRYTGKQNIGLGELSMKAMTELQSVMAIEKKHKKFLEELAVKTVLDMEDFEFIKDLIESGELEIDAKLVSMDDMNIHAEIEQGEEEEQPDPENTYSLAEVLMDDDEKKARMALANTISQGMALNAQYVFHMLEDELSPLSPHLIKQYGFFVSFATLGYFATPPGMEEMAQGMQAGQADVDDESGVYTIKARGIMFPVLIQEIVKGIYQYLSLTNGLQGADDFSLEDESKDIILGPDISSKIRDSVPSGKSKYIPVIIQHILRELDNDEIKNIFRSPQQAKSIFADIIKGIEDGELDD